MNAEKRSALHTREGLCQRLCDYSICVLLHKYCNSSLAIRVIAPQRLPLRASGAWLRPEDRFTDGGDPRGKRWHGEGSTQDD